MSSRKNIVSGEHCQNVVMPEILFGRFGAWPKHDYLNFL